MELKNKELYYGFRLLDSVHDEDEQLNIYAFVHEKSGAHLIYCVKDEQDSYKYFNIGFRTYAENDLGLPHILEHSLFAGSRKYPMRYPIAAYEKNSIAQEANAITQRNKTRFYFGTENLQDFRNLLDMHLDAVFYPAIYDNDLILKQEGWRYELQEDGSIDFNGIVYNEMQDNISSRLASAELLRQNYPGSYLGYIAGGDPLHIPEVTQEDLLAYHRKYYLPQNAYIAISGDVDLEATLAYIDKEYLSHFTYDSTKEIPIQRVKQPEQPLEITVEAYDPYVAENMQMAFGYSWYCGPFEDPVHYRDIYTLSQLLLRNVDSPIARVVSEAGYGEITLSNFEEVVNWLEIRFSISTHDLSVKDKILLLVKETVAELVESHSLELLLEQYIAEVEDEEATNINDSLALSAARASISAQRWMDGRQDVLYIYRHKYLDYLYELANQKGYLEQLARTYLLENKQFCITTVIPTLDDQGRSMQEQALLQKHMESLTPAKLEQIREDNERLTHWQSIAQDYGSLPSLKVEDLDWKVPELNLQISSWKKGTLIYRPQKLRSGLVYFYCLVQPSALSYDDLYFLRIFDNVFWDLASRHFTAAELREISYHTNLAKSYNLFKDKDTKLILPVLEFSCSCQVDKLEYVLATIEDVISGMHVENLTKLKLEMEEMLERGRGADISDMQTKLDAENNGLVYDSYLNNLAMLKDVLDNWEQEGKAFLEKMCATVAKAFADNKRTIIYACREEVKQEIEPILGAYVAKSSCAAPELMDSQYPCVPAKLGIITQKEVQDLIIANNLEDQGLSRGSLGVLSMIIEGEYLYKKVRESGGAYDASFYVDIDELGFSFSISRDNNITRTYELIKAIPDWLEQLEISDDLLQKYIISTYGDWYLMDAAPMLDSVMGRIVNLYFNCYSSEQNQKNWYSIKNTTLNEIKAWAQPLREALQEPRIFATGTSYALKQSGLNLEKIMTYDDFFRIYAGVDFVEAE